MALRWQAYRMKPRRARTPPTEVNLNPNAAVARADGADCAGRGLSRVGVSLPAGARVHAQVAAATVRQRDGGGRPRLRRDGPRDDGGTRLQDPDVVEGRPSS